MIDIGRSSAVATPLPFTLNLPTRIRFGRGVRAALGVVAAGYGRRVVLVSGASLETNAAASETLPLLEAAGVSVVDHVRASGEPDDGRVLEAGDRVRVADPAVVVAVGGGSVLDLAKAAALRPTAEQLDAWLTGERVETPVGVPVIAVPTTAGSGAEVSHAAIVLDRAARRKRGVRGPGVAARVAVVDPELTVSTTPAITAASGFDALAHAVETAASRAASDLVVNLAAVALVRLLRSVPRSMDDPADPAAREEASYAALLMGINLATSSTCLPHRLQYPVGAATRTTHPRGVAALMPAWLHRTAVYAPWALARLAIAAGLVDPRTGDAEAAARLVDVVLEHMAATDIACRLADLGVAGADVAGLAAAVEGSIANDPVPTTADDIAELYRASL